VFNVNAVYQPDMLTSALRRVLGKTAAMAASDG